VRERGDCGCYTGGGDGELRHQEGAVPPRQLRAAHASSDDGDDADHRRLVPCRGDGGGVAEEPVGSAGGTAPRKDRRLPQDHTAGTSVDHHLAVTHTRTQLNVIVVFYEMKLISTTLQCFYTV